MLYSPKGKHMKKLIVVCATIVLLAGIGSWVYVQRQNVAAKDRQAKAQAAQDLKKLKYQECQTNNRQIFGDHSSTSAFDNLRVQNCDLLL
jgi:uncharacterized protein HemX